VCLQRAPSALPEGPQGGRRPGGGAWKGSHPKQLSEARAIKIDSWAPSRGFLVIFVPKWDKAKLKHAPRGPGTFVKYDILSILVQRSSRMRQLPKSNFEHPYEVF